MKFNVIGPVDPQPRYPNHFKFVLAPVYGYDGYAGDVTVLVSDKHPLLEDFVRSISRKMTADEIEGSEFERWFLEDEDGEEIEDNPAELAGYDGIFIEWPYDNDNYSWAKYDGYTVTWFNPDGEEQRVSLELN